MMNQFDDLHLKFNGNMNEAGLEPVRSRFLDENGRVPPIRGIVKEFGQRDENLTTVGARKLLSDIINLHRLGIINLDVAHRQVISGKLSDFSTAITIPHFQTSPELNPNLSHDQISAMEFETFQLSSNDYWCFDEMIEEINWDKRQKKKKIEVYALPDTQTRYVLRNKPPTRFYTLVDPRKGEGVTKEPPVKWYYDPDDDRLAGILSYKSDFSTFNEWVYKDKCIFPRKRGLHGK